MYLRMLPIVLTPNTTAEAARYSLLLLPNPCCYWVWLHYKALPSKSKDVIIKRPNFYRFYDSVSRICQPALRASRRHILQSLNYCLDKIAATNST